MCGDDDDTQAQDDELSLSANEVPQGSDGGESFILDLPGQQQDQLRVLDYSANLDYYQPPLDFLNANCLPRWTWHNITYILLDSLFDNNDSVWSKI